MKRRWFALIVLLLAGAMALFWPSDKTSIGHAVTFSDGTTFTLLDVTYGTEHRPYGGGLRERLIALLPRKLAQKFSSRMGVMATGRPAVVLWFQRVGNGPPVGDPHLVLCDGTDFGVWVMDSMMPLGPSSNGVEGWACEIWPRREQYFTMRVYESISRWGEAKAIGEFLVRNPAPGQYPQWAPKPLPQMRRQGDLSLTLLNLVSAVGPGSMRHERARNPVHSITRADFHIKENDRLTKEWGLISVESSDATGNLIERGWGWGQDGDIEVAELRPHPWPAESAWNLRVGVSRKSNFSADELWTLRVPLSDAHLTNKVLIETNLQGTVLSYTGQKPRLSSGVRGNRHFHFHVPRGQTGYVITFVKATDDEGRSAVLENWWQGPNERTFGVTVNTNSIHLDLTVALHRTRYFEFRAPPSVSFTNEAARP